MYFEIIYIAPTNPWTGIDCIFGCESVTRDFPLVVFTFALFCVCKMLSELTLVLIFLKRFISHVFMISPLISDHLLTLV